MPQGDRAGVPSLGPLFIGTGQLLSRVMDCFGRLAQVSSGNDLCRLGGLFPSIESLVLQLVISE